jgi:hypothetical protein
VAASAARVRLGRASRSRLALAAVLAGRARLATAARANREVSADNVRMARGDSEGPERATPVPLVVVGAD